MRGIFQRLPLASGNVASNQLMSAATATAAAGAAAAAAAAAAGGSKKRKMNDGDAVDAAGQPADDHHPPTPQIGRKSFDRSLHKAIAALLAIKNAATAAIQQLQTKAEAIKELIESTGGKLELTGGIEGEVEVNVGGRVVGVSRKGLMLDQLRRTYFAHLLLYCVDALPRDEEGRPFLDADPKYVDWLSDEISMAECADASAEEHEIKLDDTQKEDPIFAFYYQLFLTHTPLDIDTQSHDVDMDDGDKEVAAEGGDEGGSGTDSMGDRLREYVEGYKAAVVELDGAAGHLKDFGKAMGPFLRAEDGTAHEVKTVTVLRKRVSATEATLSQFGPANPLYKRFSGEIVGDVPIRQTAVEHLMKVVDFARRLRLEHRPGSIVKHPIARNMTQLKKDVEMYGLKMEDVYRPPAPLLRFEETREVLAMTEIPNPSIKLLYSSTRDGGDFGTMVDKVGDASGLLFLVNHNETHRFGVFVDGQLKPPAGYKVPHFFISISGAYAKPTKIPIPEGDQKVRVAGRLASIKAPNVDKRGKLYLGRGYLWLAFGSPGPADDVRSMFQWVKKEDMADGYIGRRNDNGDGTLADKFTFTAKEIAIYHVKSD
ncbi:unnamed protein product [Vitrella brassicaformis CCMP3155]|uniref:TLDc domain-containing protein n=1 Tax=Vitrella brassicaformis (strain CCMP3155) TaxID=1169540 RepID=A0A0G4FS85_VITBC|nr:unnamed protein product [Vitrella brassicaformis CCMP3155]|eukprot:CEM17051.1 unnamed protein product [Vitrella brassicaformis CCMP3155]